MSAVSVQSLWFADALKDRRLKKAARRLRLGRGEFVDLEKRVATQTASRESIRMFFAEGPRGGVHGILLACRPKGRGPIRVGVYVDRKSRRKNIGSNLVEAARTYYPHAALSSIGWNEASIRFWNKLKHVTGHAPKDYR